MTCFYFSCASLALIVNVRTVYKNNHLLHCLYVNLQITLILLRQKTARWAGARTKRPSLNEWTIIDLLDHRLFVSDDYAALS